MEGIDRITLYTHIQNILKGNNDTYKFIIEFFEEAFINQINLCLQLNITMLRDIENRFFLSFHEDISELDFNKIIKMNIKQVMDLKELIGEKKLKKLEKIPKTVKKSSNQYYKFNSLINGLNEITEAILKKEKITKDNFHNKIKIKEHEFKNHVFLSHAFYDQLYTFCLFIFMYEKGILLYVDWIFSEEFDNGVDIKANLLRHLVNSRQLLFLRTINSELSIRGSGNIRGWCSWELGSFYTIKEENKDEKYYIALYENKTNPIRNRQLDGMKPLSGIEFGRLR